MSSHVLNIVPAVGGAGATTLSALFGPAAEEISRDALTRPRPPDQSPWTLILATEGVEQASAAVALREHALENGWRVAAIATRGPEKRRPRAVQARFIPITADERDTRIERVPHWPQAARMPLAALPEWDFKRPAKRTSNGLPPKFPLLFSSLMDYIVNEEDEAEQPQQEQETYTA